MLDPRGGDCPTLADLAAFCWGQAPSDRRAAIVRHLAVCVACRTRAARIAATCRTDQGDPGDESDR
jgi:anti-sigma factor RsiW